ncbi:MAG TPA: EamA family transporter, partial [Fervidobacterium sp.]|nr:EamA family transporter [Fervidobacterium sp.]
MEAGIESRIQQRAILFAILAAALYAMSSPISKLLLKQVSPTFMASFLYLGAGIGMALVGFVKIVNGTGSSEMKLTAKEVP